MINDRMLFADRDRNLAAMNVFGDSRWPVFLSYLSLNCCKTIIKCSEELLSYTTIVSECAVDSLISRALERLHILFYDIFIYIYIYIYMNILLIVLM